MTQLRQRMTDDMTVRGLAENTKKSYLNSVAGLARHYRRNPDRISAPEVQDYLIHLHEQRGLTWQSCNCVRHGVRFLYRITLGLPDPHFYLPGAKTSSTLPQILNRDELVRLFTVTTNRKHRALPMAAYAAGLRASELVQLQLSDIDSERMCLCVDQQVLRPASASRASSTSGAGPPPIRWPARLTSTPAVRDARIRLSTASSACSATVRLNLAIYARGTASELRIVPTAPPGAARLRRARRTDSTAPARRSRRRRRGCRPGSAPAPSSPAGPP